MGKTKITNEELKKIVEWADPIYSRVICSDDAPKWVKDRVYRIKSEATKLINEINHRRNIRSDKFQEIINRHNDVAPVIPKNKVKDPIAELRTIHKNDGINQ